MICQMANGPRAHTTHTPIDKNSEPSLINVPSSRNSMEGCLTDIFLAFSYARQRAGELLSLHTDDMTKALDKAMTSQASSVLATVLYHAVATGNACTVMAENVWFSLPASYASW